ncbi:hypothetical protein PHACT_07245 [Pseudohongiella acticola]|uniref:Uncharacterized protein n=1 Tax=Pseudohongiella acticola TaxID=1524254 RepID=A0A1E8CKL4_9GAMM|nr:hypothetical protein PHACT_07245 [Pseudohongiella acticola]
MAQASASMDGLNICVIVILFIVKISFLIGCQSFNGDTSVFIPENGKKIVSFMFSVKSAEAGML